LEALRVDDVAALAFEASLAASGTADLHVDGQSFPLARDMWSAKSVTKTFAEEKFVPSVAVLPLSNAKEFTPIVQELERQLRTGGIQAKSDTSGVAIGRKYARADELGIPLGVTIDFETLVDHAVTVRERDSCAQIRVPVADVVGHLRAVVEGRATWETLTATYPVLDTKKE
ncbi:hypothetical protein DYB35_011739, partial [Aphanomyces astaci]